MDKALVNQYGIGVDLCSIERVGQLLKWYDQSTLSYLFNDSERQAIDMADNPAHTLALCFAAKEAAGKCLGTGLAGHDISQLAVTVKEQHVCVKVANLGLLLEGKWFDCEDNLVCVSLRVIE